LRPLAHLYDRLQRCPVTRSARAQCGGFRGTTPTSADGDGGALRSRSVIAASELSRPPEPSGTLGTLHASAFSAYAIPLAPTNVRRKAIRPVRQKTNVARSTYTRSSKDTGKQDEPSGRSTPLQRATFRIQRCCNLEINLATTRMLTAEAVLFVRL